MCSSLIVHSWRTNIWTKIMSQFKPSLNHPTSTLLLHSGSQKMCWCPAQRVRVAFLLNLTIQMLLILATLSQPCPRTMFYKLSGIPLTQPSQYIKLTISYKLCFGGIMGDFFLTNHNNLGNLSLEFRIPHSTHFFGSKTLEDERAEGWSHSHSGHKG